MAWFHPSGEGFGRSAWGSNASDEGFGGSGEGPIARSGASFEDFGAVLTAWGASFSMVGMSLFVNHLKSLLSFAKRGIDLGLAARRRKFADWIEHKALQNLEEARELHADWSRHLEGWALGLADDLEVLKLDAEMLRLALDTALAWRLGIEATTGSKVRDWDIAAHSHGRDKRDERFPLAYARALGLLVEVDGRQQITRAGEILLDSSSQEALRWLLTLELLRTTGIGDPWFVWPELLEGFVAQPQRYFDWMDRDLSRSWATGLGHLMELGVVSLVDEARMPTREPHGLLIAHAPLLSLLQEVLRTPDTPMGVLAQAVLQDARPTAAPPADRSATSTAIRHARLVTHELSNALVPIQQAVGSLRRSLDQGAERASQHRDLERVERSLGRIFSFVARQQELVELGSPGEEVFDPRSVIEAAITTVKNGVGAPVSAELPAELPPVRGLPEHLLMVVVTVLRNGVEAVGAKGEVRLRAGTSPRGGLLIAIEDDGPGVPPGVVPFLFEPGFSTRTGGSGMGLTLARETLTTWGGEIRYEAGVGGGACFILTLPSVSRA